MHDHLVEDRSIFGLLIYFVAYRYKNFSYVIKTFIVIKSMKKIYILKKTLKFLSRSAFSDEFLS